VVAVSSLPEMAMMVLPGPATALLIIGTDMSIMVTTIMVMIGMMIGADEQKRGGDDRTGHDHDRHRRHQQQQRVR
jgi:hypothetical protein